MLVPWCEWFNVVWLDNDQAVGGEGADEAAQAGNGAGEEGVDEPELLEGEGGDQADGGAAAVEEALVGHCLDDGEDHGSERGESAWMED